LPPRKNASAAKIKIARMKFAIGPRGDDRGARATGL
jgi:hypothetical protein